MTFSRGSQTRLPTDPLPAAPETRDPSGFKFEPLWKPARALWSGETPATGMVAQLETALCNETSASLRFLYTFPHMGGKHLAELDWRDYETDPSNPSPGPGGYHATFVDDIKRAYATAKDAALTYQVFAFHLTQGENEGRGYLMPGGPHLEHTAFVAAYKSALAAAYKRWDADARAITNQSAPVPLFISQVNNYWAGQAQAQLADECPHVFLVGPFYYAPSALNSVWHGNTRGHRIHLAADGQRWRGEQAGKVMARVILEGETWLPLQPRIAKRLGKTVVLKFDVPRPPLVFETSWLPKAPNFGFEVHCGTQDKPGVQLPIRHVDITGQDEVSIFLDENSSFDGETSAFVTYGQTMIVASTSNLLKSVCEGQPFDYGIGSTELSFEGNICSDFSNLLVEGCFVIIQLSDSETKAAMHVGLATSFDSPCASIVAREVRFEGGLTIVRGETRSVENSFVAGRVCFIERDRRFGNLRDSDSAGASFVFHDTSYGKRQGQPYPLHNFCVVFTKQID